MNHLGEKCHEITFSPYSCPVVESNPEISYWVKGDGCCELEDVEDDLCEPKKNKKKTTTKASTKPTTKPKTKPSTNDVDSGLKNCLIIVCRIMHFFRLDKLVEQL